MLGDEKCGKQRTEGAAGVAADLKKRLGEAMAATGREPGDAGGFGVENGGAETDEPAGDEHGREGGGKGEQQQADERQDHAGSKRVGLRMAVGEQTDNRLEQRRGELKCKGDEADLGEGEVEGVLEKRVECREQRLDGVVEQMAHAEGAENPEGGRRFGHRRGGRRGGHAEGALGGSVEGGSETRPYAWASSRDFSVLRRS